MYRFWNLVIEPIFEILQPKLIVEIGSDNGDNTRNLLEYCKRNDALLHVIDPHPKYEVSEWQERYGKVLVFHKSLSLNAIQLIDGFDVVLIDGDHNWYTVNSELKLIESSVKKLSRPFPLVMFHDIGWPYGRRDLYYDPDNIPEAYRKPYRQQGLRQESSELINEGGLNSHLCNAIYENDLQNGVLTAIEDFIEQTELTIDLVKVPGLHGLGILVPSHLMEDKKLEKIFRSLKFSAFTARYIDNIEKSRIDSEIGRHEQGKLLKNVKSELSEAVSSCKKEVESLQDKLKGRAAELQSRETEVADIKERLGEAEREVQEKIRQLSETEKKWKTEVEDLEGELKCRAAELQSRETEVADVRELLKKHSQDIEGLINWIEKLDTGISALLKSRRWRIGKAIGDIYRKVLFRPYLPTPIEYINKITGEFRGWHEKHSKYKYNSKMTLARHDKSSDIYSNKISHTGVSKCSFKKKIKVSVIAWDLAHNPAGRAHIIADMLSRKFDVELIGAKNPVYGTEIWEPLRNSTIPTIDFTGTGFPAHFQKMVDVAKDLNTDVVYVSKPRLPSYELGILAKSFKNIPVILDVDDYELSFFGMHKGMTLDDVEALREKEEFSSPHGQLWTRYCDSIIPYADHITVSNVELQKKYGGTILPHIRDERLFDPSLYDRNAIRAKFGFTSDEKVILFIGTPRLHKGIVEIAEALERLGNPSYKLCVIGTVTDHNLNARLKGLKGDHLHFIPNQPYSDLPTNLVIGDLICLLQDPQNDIAKYQMPAKFTDALAMNIPILATAAPPLANLARSNLVELLGNTSLDKKIDEIFSNYACYKQRAVENRKIFLEEYSYGVNVLKLEMIIHSLIEKTPPMPDEFERLIRFHNEIFLGPSGINSGPRTNMHDEAPDKKSCSNAPQLVTDARTDDKTTTAYVDDKYDFVFFWKQNDTGIYGRRQDMIVKYLSKSSRVNKIIHLDAPLSIKSLWANLKLDKGRKFSQSNLIFFQTLSRLLGIKNSRRCKYYTFLYYLKNQRGALTRWLLPSKDGYIHYIKSVMTRNGIGKRKTIFWVCPKNFEFPEIANALKTEFIVADVIDDHRGWFKPDSSQVAELDKNYEEILALSDLTLANCKNVQTSMLKYHDNVHLIPNACELPEKGEIKTKQPRELRKLKGPIIGYVGNLSSRIDIDLLEYIAKDRPHWNLVLIGSMHLSKEVLMRLSDYENVHFLGVKIYAKVRQYISNFDVAIIPHLDNDLTRSMNPLKLFVYCSMNVPVVTTDVANIDELRDMVAVASGKNDFVAKVENVLRMDRTAGVNRKHMEVLEKETWNERVQKILELIDNEWESRSIDQGAQI